jgi:hypothetical protein
VDVDARPEHDVLALGERLACQRAAVLFRQPGKAVALPERIPTGPSVMRMLGMPSRGRGFESKPVPLSMSSFSSSVIFASSSLTRASRAVSGAG